MANKKGGLGRGLDALFDQNSSGSTEITTLRLSEIEPNREQPRVDFNEQTLVELAESIKEHGILQPLLVRPVSDKADIYQIVAGERRWRAARMAGLTEVPVVIRELSDIDAAQVALIENLQREDLNPIEEAMGYKSLIDDYGMTQEQVAKKVGKGRPTIANALRLLALPDKVAGLLREGKISSGHARTLLSFPDEESQWTAAEACMKGASVREIERMAKKSQSPDEPAPPVEIKNPVFSQVELALREELGRRVKISVSNGKGLLEVEFYNNDDLFDLANRLGNRRRQY